MAKLIQPFDATKVDPTQGAGSLPIGRHPVIITESEVEGTKGGNGGMLILMLKIIDGPQTGTTGAYRLNLYNQNPQACQIAERQLSAVCHSINVFNVDDTAVMHNKPFMVEVGFQKGHEPGSSPDAKGYTEVKKVFDSQGNEPGKKGAQQQTQQQNNNGGQFDAQQGQFQQKQEAQGPAGNMGGNGNAWGNNGNNGNNANQNPAQSGNPSGNNNGGGNGWGQQPQGQQQMNQGGNNGGNWGNGSGGQPTNQGGSGGGQWQQNAGGAQNNGGGNGWGQRN